MWWDAHETFKKRIFDQKNVFLWMVTSKKPFNVYFFYDHSKTQFYSEKVFFQKYTFSSKNQDSMWV